MSQRMIWFGESRDLSVSMMFRLAGLASIHLISIELEIIFVPLWVSRNKYKIMLASVRRTLRAGPFPKSIGFPFKEGTKKTSTGLLDFERFQTKVERG